MRSSWALVACSLTFTLPPLCGAAAPSQLEATAPLRDFFLPFFNGDGLKIWDARGTEAEFFPDSHRLLIRNLYVRLFDELDGNTLKVILESPVAEMDAEENRIFGGDFIHIVGNLFTAIGGQWTFFGDDHTVVLEKDIQVFLETNVAKSLSEASPMEVDGGGAIADDGFTTISGDSLQVVDATHGFVLEFSGSVVVQSNNFLLTCDHLELETLSERPVVLMKEKISDDAIRHIKASGSVEIEEKNRTIDANFGEIFPAEGVAVFSGDVTVRSAGGTLRGQRIVLRQREARVVVDEDNVVRQSVSFDCD